MAGPLKIANESRDFKYVCKEENFVENFIF